MDHQVQFLIVYLHEELSRLCRWLHGRTSIPAMSPPKRHSRCRSRARKPFAGQKASQNSDRLQNAACAQLQTVSSKTLHSWTLGTEGEQYPALASNWKSVSPQYRASCLSMQSLAVNMLQAAVRGTLLGYLLSWLGGSQVCKTSELI